MIDPNNILFIGMLGVLFSIPIVAILSQRDALFKSKDKKPKTEGVK